MIDAICFQSLNLKKVMIFISRWQHHSATAIREMVFLHCRFNNRQTQKRTGLELTIEKTVRCAELQPNRMSRRTVKKLLLCIQLPLLPVISLDWQPTKELCSGNIRCAQQNLLPQLPYAKSK